MDAAVSSHLTPSVPVLSFGCAEILGYSIGELLSTESLYWESFLN